MSIFFLFQKISYCYFSLYMYMFNKAWSTASDFIRFWKCWESIYYLSSNSFCGDCIKRPPVIWDLFTKVRWRVTYDSLDCTRNFIMDNMLYMHVCYIIWYKRRCVTWPGHYKNIPVERRKCPSCKTDIEDEFHFMLKCPTYQEFRIKFLKPYYYRIPSVFKLTQLLSTENVRELCNIGKFIKNAFIVRKTISWLSCVYYIIP